MTNEKEIAASLVLGFQEKANISRRAAIECAKICIGESQGVASMFVGLLNDQYQEYSGRVLNEVNKL